MEQYFEQLNESLKDIKSDMKDIRELNTEIQRRSITTEISLDALKKELIGNGQPGRLPKLESKVEKLMTWKNWLKGIGVAIGFMATTGIAVAKALGVF